MAGRFSVEAVFSAVDRITAPVSRMQTRIGRFTRSMSRGLRTANRVVGKLVGGLARGARTVAKFGGAMLGLGAAATVSAINRTADAADALAKQSRRLDFPIEDLQEFKFVAEQSGVSTDLLDSSLGAFSKRLGEAAGGTGPLVTGLKNINPELLKQLQSADSISDAFSLYIDAMRDAGSATERAALANAAFSRAGLKLANISDNSAASIKALREEQRQNGNITMAQAVAAEAYGDAVNTLKKSLIGLVQQVLLPMLPAITKTLLGWRDWIAANREMLQTRITQFMLELKDRVLDVVDAVVEFSKKYDLGERISDTLDTLGQFGRFLGENGVMILKVVATVVALSLVLKTLAVVMAVVNVVMALNPVGLIVLGIVALIAAIAAAVIYWDDIKAAIQRFGAAIMDEVAPAIDWLKGAAGSVTSAWSAIGDFFADLWGGVTNTFESAWAKIESIVNKIRGALDFVSNSAGKIKDAAGGAVDRATGAVSDAASGVAGFFGFGDGEEATATAGGGRGGQMVSPQERVARSVEESRSTSTSEVTIRDETGRAEVTSGRMGPGLKLQPSGAF